MQSSGRSIGNILPCEVSTASSRSSRNQKEQEKLEMAQQMAKRRIMLGVSKTNASVTVRNSGVKFERPVKRAGTRGYRAPEVLMGMQCQTTAVDVWAAGVVLLTLLCRTTQFQWFQYNDIVTATMEIYGLRMYIKSMDAVWKLLDVKIPPLELHLSYARGFKQTWRTLSSSLGAHAGCKDWLEVDEKHAIWDFLNCCLNIDPRTRITALEALKHPFLISAVK
ncbi:hypothetical protein GUITHDRAFT_99883 [Guillardia theta CCMP2712]|nr:hypothetical protein GUITHDRAFT_107905 [Guillardia theta CCMP2712]XP_005841382.1 hypothetical protein GUITHDRAFT_99883 [Guillardia theta CCMP2712]EKX46294.1 hypothetical protein GUITHDRAFT_107905 [Guillardia theta CCMP2712]EKX54402.1 hypothetical protein GUITHDRAFT_99883 [Guillardia theta CCMP2712]|eukprot:XP_005833274.1 hypothetical protein GUITHDRAFT_107905 [Guillardia theta CCMP2712]